MVSRSVRCRPRELDRMRHCGRLPLLLAATLLVVSWSGRRASAEEMDSLSTSHFDFRFFPEHRKVAERLAANAEEVRSRHCALLPRCDEGPYLVRIARDEREFLELQPYEAHIDWAAGVAYADLSLIVLRLDKDMLLTMEETFEHEVSHLLLLRILPKRPPRWFIEGLAIHQAGQDLLQKLETVSAAAFSGGPLPLSRLDESFPGTAGGRELAYAQSGLIVSYMANRFGKKALSKLITALSYGMRMPDAVTRVFGISLEKLEEDWTGTLSRFAWLRGLTDSWGMWFGLSLLFIAVVAVRMVRNRRRKRQMAPPDPDWEYRH
ncbi:MAG: hypothetical protein FJ109_12535 [Deltaproteobacteria bacterium]|nr:hypothetical protein [Deltaproteobacteria bacterium]